MRHYDRGVVSKLKRTRQLRPARWVAVRLNQLTESKHVEPRMERWRTGVQIPPPPPNTGEGLDYVRPLETSISGASSTSPLLSYMVSGGLDRPLAGHNLGTFGTDPTQHFSPLSFALSKTNHLGTTECLLLREKIFSAHPDLSLPMASNYLAIADKRSYQDANQNLLNLHNRLVVHDLNLSASFEELEKFADEKAAYMVQLAATFNGDSKAAYAACSEYVQRLYWSS